MYFLKSTNISLIHSIRIYCNFHVSAEQAQEFEFHWSSIKLIFLKDRQKKAKPPLTILWLIKNFIQVDNTVFIIIFSTFFTNISSMCISIQLVTVKMKVNLLKL